VSGETDPTLDIYAWTPYASGVGLDGMGVFAFSVGHFLVGLELPNQDRFVVSGVGNIDAAALRWDEG